MFSEELRILDRNTVKYMIEEQQQEIDNLKALNEQQKIEYNAQINEKDAQIESLKKELDVLRNK